jgi:hypothetical protein
LPSRFLGSPASHLALLTLVLLPSSCTDDSGATGPDTSQLEILILAGDGQMAESGALLPDPLSVRVQAQSNGRVEEGVTVDWDVVAGEGATVDQPTTVTDSAGVTSVRLTLGEGLGIYRVKASVKGMSAPPVEFEARAIETPELTLAPAGPVEAGELIHLEGRHFSPVPQENVVTFSLVRGRVAASTETTMEVEVPPCLPSGTVQLRVRIGALSAPPASLEVTGGNEFFSMGVGEDRILDPTEALSCVRFPSSPETYYLVIPHSTGTVGGAEYPVTVTGLTEGGSGVLTTPPIPPRRAPALPRSDRAGLGPVPEFHWEWENGFRSWEKALVDGIGYLGSGLASADQRRHAAPRATPAVGEAREFSVVNSENKFDRITARVHSVTEHSIIYVDEEAPGGGFTDGDLDHFSSQFDGPIHGAVTEAFGSESDLDGNERVIILFTPGVNRLTSASSGGYVGGFFFGLDLLPKQDGSNGGEIFYAVVPDPSGIHGPVLDRSTLLRSLPSILAHEFGHMVHFNQRLLLSEAESQEALWLSEALAQMAEDMVGVALEEEGDLVRALDYQLGNWDRARRFLLDPSQVSVLATLPPGTLAERGAGWLLLRHLYGREGKANLLRALTRSTRTGVENVRSVIGRSWPDIVSDWAGSLYLDGLTVPVRSGLTILDLDLRSVLARLDGTYPLQPRLVGRSPFSISGALWSSAPGYYILTPPEKGGVALNVSGPDGRPPDGAAGLRVLVVRLR